MSGRWRIAVDVGGTFTDAVGLSPDGVRHRAKILSADAIRADGVPAPIAAVHAVTSVPFGSELPPVDLRVGTTRGTNALLVGATSRVLMVLPHGLADILEIGDQRRPDLFAWHPVRPRPPLHAVVTTMARVSSRGDVVSVLDEAEAARVVEAVRVGVHDSTIDAIGIALLHADVDPSHERKLASAIGAATGLPVTCSHEMGRVAGFVDRANATHADALLTGPIRGFVTSIRDHLPAGSALHMMTSAGGLVAAAEFRPKDSLLSGPAGGVRGALASATSAALGPVLAFDMGGTSTDISRLDGEVPLAFHTTVAGVSVASPCVAVDTIAAGGGSIVRCIGGAIQVGPESAGSDPGPACMGRGGPLTVTDLDLLSGRLQGVPMALDRMAAERALDAEREAFTAARGPASPGEFVAACLALANETMAAAIRRAAVRRGFSPESHTLLAFGGAGPLHACAIADRLGISTIVVPADAGLLSAVGIESAMESQVLQRGLRQRLDGSIEWERVVGQLRAEGAPDGWRTDRTIVLMRLAGQESSIAVEVPGEPVGPDVEQLLARLFRERYLQVYTTPPPARPIEVESVQLVVVRGCTRAGAEAGSHAGSTQESRAARQAGPATINRMDCTIHVAEGWHAQGRAEGSVVLVRHLSPATADATAHELLHEESMAARLSGIADEMGELLRRTAVSVNVKDRLDYSCSVLDADGSLVANAPHLPVHLGSMGACVREATRGLDLGPGDAVVVNHPAYGGSHLPDITVITPVFSGAARRIGYVASRAHHAELGGPRPGSMPPDATRLEGEAIVIPPTFVRRSGVTNLTAGSALLRLGPFPSRLPEENELDLLAQLAANEQGAAAERALDIELGPDGVADAFTIIRRAARARARVAIESLPGDTLQAQERLDDGSPLRVSITRHEGRLLVDFSGSATIHPRSFNAPAAVIRSVVMYVLRLIAGRQCPGEAAGMVLNEGFLDDVQITGLGGMLGPDIEPGAEWPAVGSGNTETSQRVTDLLLKAAGVCACGQGTMNNLLYGNARFGFYETIAGGAGASPAGAGLGGVHTHMTNTRVTDPEILERRLPVRLERFQLRRGSGGDGLARGGDGVVRRIRFLEPVQLSLISQHRVEPPFGGAGGGPGRCGEQHVLRADGRVEPLGGVATIDLAAGDAIEIQTPGGGGWGKGVR